MIFRYVNVYQTWRDDTLESIAGFGGLYLQQHGGPRGLWSMYQGLGQRLQESRLRFWGLSPVGWWVGNRDFKHHTSSNYEDNYKWIELINDGWLRISSRTILTNILGIITSNGESRSTNMCKATTEGLGFTAHMDFGPRIIRYFHGISMNQLWRFSEPN